MQSLRHVKGKAMETVSWSKNSAHNMTICLKTKCYKIVASNLIPAGSVNDGQLEFSLSSEVRTDSVRRRSSEQRCM